MDDRLRGLRRVISSAEGVPGQGDWASAICRAAVDALPGVSGAALTLRAGQRAEELLSASAEWVARLAVAQYTTGEGPGVDANASGEPVLIADLHAEAHRWPGFGSVALHEGVAAMFAFPLATGGIRMGTLDLYSNEARRLDAATLADGRLLADLATLALLGETQRASSDAEEWTRPALSYGNVNMATGMLAAQLNIPLADAFARLRAHAFAENRSLLDVAGDVLARRIRLDQTAE